METVATRLADVNAAYFAIHLVSFICLFGLGWVRLAATAKTEAEFMVNKICGTIFLCSAMIIAYV